MLQSKGKANIASCENYGVVDRTTRSFMYEQVIKMVKNNFIFNLQTTFFGRRQKNMNRLESVSVNCKALFGEMSTFFWSFGEDLEKYCLLKYSGIIGHLTRGYLAALNDTKCEKFETF